MKKNNLFQYFLLVGLISIVILLALMFAVDSMEKHQQIKQLQSSVSYLSGKCEQLQKQSDKQQRQINQDYLILSQGWKD